MRTFKKVRPFGNGTNSGATAGKSNEAVLLVNGAAVSTSVTFQCYNPNGSTFSVGPIAIAASQSLIWPVQTYGWTAAAGISGYELF